MCLSHLWVTSADYVINRLVPSLYHYTLVEKQQGAGEMAQQLGAQAALTVDLSSVPSAHNG